MSDKLYVFKKFNFDLSQAEIKTHYKYKVTNTSQWKNMPNLFPRNQ